VTSSTVATGLAISWWLLACATDEETQQWEEARQRAYMLAAVENAVNV